MAGAEAGHISGLGAAGNVTGMTETLRAVKSPPPGQVAGRPVVEIVLPIYNEQAALEASVRRVYAFTATALWVPWRITIADNASSDASPAIGRRLAGELSGVRYLRLERKGRGRALRSAWSQSPADVVVYMDVDLSTDLGALVPLIAPLLSGHSAIAIGSRLTRGACVTRGWKREVISRCYNRILRSVLRVRFTDAQCGFKAMVEDEAWFFDTELLVLAERAGLRIHEIPVDWVDDLDSRVDIVATAAADLRGVVRMRRQLRVPRLRRRLAAIGSAPLRPVPMSAAAGRAVLKPLTPAA
jgi:glycosyltransferase involved in cell wall biosynthesis